MNRNSFILYPAFISLKFQRTFYEGMNQSINGDYNFPGARYSDVYLANTSACIKKHSNTGNACCSLQSNLQSS